MKGTILEITTTPAGDELAADNATGETVLELTNIDDFDQVNFGSVEIDGDVYDYVAVDPVAITITISAPGLLRDMLTSEKVLLSPKVEEKWAMVEVQQDEDPVSALVPQSLWDRLVDGVREPEDQESVEIEARPNGDMAIVDVLGQAPRIDGTLTIPDTATVSPEVDALLAELVAQVNDNTTQINNNVTDIQNVGVTAQQAQDKAATADGRISISDYEPSTGDAEGRTEGSIWFVRTRPRINWCWNPSFETNTSNLYMDFTSVVLESAPGPVDGTKVLKVTNDGTSFFHMVSAFPPAAVVVAEGQMWTFSGYCQSVSGVATGWLAQIVWYDAALAIIGYSTGDTKDLTTTDWVRPFVTGAAPANAAYALFRMVAPVGSEGAVWRTDAWVVEQSDELGRYFDGSSYDAVWYSTAHSSISIMEGGKIVKAFELADGSWTLKQWMGDTLQDINASEIKFGTLDGNLLADQSVATDKTAGSPATALETMTAGTFVNVLNSSGLFKVQKACAADGRECDGFILDEVTAGGTVYVYSWGNNPLLSALVPGTLFLSTNAGTVSSTPPQDIGQFVQSVGSAIGPTVMNFTRSKPIYIV